MKRSESERGEQRVSPKLPEARAKLHLFRVFEISSDPNPGICE